MQRPSLCPCRALVSLAVVGSAACTTTPAPPDLAPAMVAVPIAIPLSDLGGDAPTPPDLYYRSVLAQMQAAWLEDRDLVARQNIPVSAQGNPALRQGGLERLRSLLALHDRPDAPEWARERLAAFQRVAKVMEFERLVLDRGAVVWPAELPAIGAPLTLTLQLGPLPSTDVVLPGRESPARTRFAVRVALLDHDALGTKLTNEASAVVDLPLAVEFAAGQMVEVPVSLDVPAGGSILRHVSAEVWLMPGHAMLEGEPVPLRRTRCARGEATLVPLGHDALAEQPALTLRNALLAGDPAHFPHVYLAARALATSGSDAERAAATAALIDRVRLGNPGQIGNAIAALGWLEPAAARLNRERGEWLQWWSARPR